MSILGQYQENLQLLCDIAQLWTLAFIGPDIMGPVVDDIDSMVD